MLIDSKIHGASDWLARKGSDLDSGAAATVKVATVR